MENDELNIDFADVERQISECLKQTPKPEIDELRVDNTMTVKKLKKLTEEEVKTFIRKSLHIDGNLNDSSRLRFDMTGYEEKNNIGSCTLHNQMVLNKFAHLGIYDFTNYLFLDFYQGIPKLYFQYFRKEENIEIDGLSGYSTTDIIYEIFKHTILSQNKQRRRRNNGDKN